MHLSLSGPRGLAGSPGVAWGLRHGCGLGRHRAAALPMAALGGGSSTSMAPRNKVPSAMRFERLHFKCHDLRGVQETLGPCCTDAPTWLPRAGPGGADLGGRGAGDVPESQSLPPADRRPRRRAAGPRGTVRVPYSACALLCVCLTVHVRVVASLCMGVMPLPAVHVAGLGLAADCCRCCRLPAVPDCRCRGSVRFGSAGLL